MCTLTVPSFAKQDAVAGLHVKRQNPSVLLDLAFADGENFAFLRLLFGGLRNNETAPSCLLFVDTTHQNPIVQRNEIDRHGYTLPRRW